ncbi:hypothetical protein EC957_001127 [Mortierella hygrophila]|uniref:Uncharacterized protein n=1 Tax=Mortierella hygrophila TaxID=979708 RepID=A0A9P6K776_9FUNG|nr:hypothetical protein EC957_001127 [Mortierella hygrophila]
MTHDLKYHASRAIDTLYEFLFDGPAYDPSTQAGSCCIKPYHGENGAANLASFAGSTGDSGGRVGRLASAVQDKVDFVASSASSAAASLVSTIGSGSGGHSHAGSHTANHHHHLGGGSGRFWDLTPTESTLSHWKSVLHDYWHSLTEHSLSSPDFWHRLQSRLGIDHLARSWNLEPHIVFLLMLVPLVLLLLSWCLIQGAGNTSEEPHGPGRKSGPTKVGEKDNQGRPTYASMVAGGSSPTSNTGKGKKVQGSKKAGAQDNAGSIKSQNQLGNDNGISSWSALLGSAGFRGGEALSYKPIDIYAAMKSGKKAIAHTVEGAFAPGHEIVGSTEAQHEQKEIGLDNKEDYIDEFPAIGEHEHNANLIDNGRAFRFGPAGPGSNSASNSSAKIRVPRPYGAKEADRHRHQPHKSSSKIERESAPYQRQAPQISFAAKLMDFAQENPVMKSLDGISGGVLGAVMATVAAIANTAEAATTSLKENIPSSVDELTHDLRNSFDKAMVEGGLEGSGFDEQDDNSHISSYTTHQTESHSSSSSSSSSSQRVKDNLGELFSVGPAMFSSHDGSTSSSSHPATDNFGQEFSKGPAMVANPPRLRKRSVVQAQPGTAAIIATAKATTAGAVPASPTAPSPSHKAAITPAHTEKSVASNPSDKFAAHTHAQAHDHAPAPTPSKATAPSSNSTKTTSASKPASAVEDISSRPATSPVTQTNSNSSSLAQKGSAQKNNVKGFTTEAIRGAKKPTSNAVKEAKDASGHVADDVMDVVEDTKKAASKAAGDVEDLVKDAKKAAASEADDVKAAANNVVGKAKRATKEAKEAKETKETKETKVAVDAAAETTHKLKGAAIDKAHGFKGTAAKKANRAAKEAKNAGDAARQKAHALESAPVKKANEATKEAKNAIDKNVVQPIKNAEKMVKDAEKEVDESVKNAAEAAQKAKGAAVKKANEATDMATKLKDTAVTKANEAAKDTKGTVDAAAEKANELKEAVVGKTDKTVEQAKDIIDRNIVQPIKNAEQKIETTVKDTEKKAEDTVKSAAQNVYKAKDAAVERASEVTHSAADTVKSTEMTEGVVMDGAETAHHAKDAAIGKAGEVVHAAADTVRNAERRLEEAIKYAAEGVIRDVDDSFDDGSLIDADEALDETAHTTAAATQSPVATKPAHIRSASPSELVQTAMNGAVDEIADVSESLSSMFAGFKDSVARAFKDVKDMASHVGPALAPASISVSPAFATGQMESSPTSSSSSSVFRHVDTNPADSKHKSAVDALTASTASVATASDASHKDATKQHQDGMVDGRSYSDVVKVTPETTPKLHAAKLPSSFPTTPATDDSSVHPHDEVPASSSDDQADAPPAEAQEYTVDEFGNKVPVVDVRRDSGFNLLM